jgi:tetratricopeptide (TPR) repeat protein
MAQDGVTGDRTGTWQGQAEPRPKTQFTLPARWQVERMLGRGGQAEVWLAHDAELDQQVAIKVFSSDLTEVQRERIKREVRLGRDVEHPGLVRVFELLDLGGRPAAVMEWLPGGSLAQALGGGPLPVSRVIEITEGTLDVLAAFHELGIVHRDVKPSNLLLDAEGRVHLADLGLALPLEAGERLTRTASSVGTPAFMSPEQLRGAEPAPAADLYSLGCTVYQLLTGRLPFDGSTEYEIAEAHLHHSAPDPRRLRPDCPAWLASFVLRLLEKRPQARWRDAGAAARAFAHRRWVTTPRFRRAVGIAAASIVAAGVLSVLLLRQHPAPAHVTVTGDTVVVSDSRGRQLWTAKPRGRVTSACVADLYGEGRPQVAIGEIVPTGVPDRTEAEIAIFGADARERIAVRLDDAARADLFPNLDPSTGDVQLFPVDADSDGLDELAYTTQQDHWYPSYLGLWNPRRSIRPELLLTNSGRIFDVRSADLDGDGVAELIITGLNNPLGFQTIVATIRTATEVSAPGEDKELESPDQVPTFVDAGRWRRRDFTYVVLGTGGQATVASAGPAGIVVPTRSTSFALDRDGNPSTSRLFGKGPDPRNEFWVLLGRACVLLEEGKLAGAEAVARSLGSADPALAEPPMRAAAALLVARSLARTGDHKLAIQVLEEGARRDPDETDLTLRLGEYLVVSGRLADGVKALWDMVGAGRQGRGTFDPGLWLQLAAAMTADRGAFGRAEVLFSAGSGYTKNILSSDLRAVWAFDRGDWSDPALAGEGSTRYYPIAALLRRWAALERGAAPSAIVAAARDLAINPERRELAALLEARAELKMGNAERSLGLAQQALDSLDRRGRAELEMYIWVPLAHRLAADALTALARPAEAKPHLARAHEIAPRCWFGTAQLRLPG